MHRLGDKSFILGASPLALDTVLQSVVLFCCGVAIVNSFLSGMAYTTKMDLNA